MIHANRILTVGEQESIIDRPIVLYRGDREVEIEFTLVGNEFMFSEEGNVIKSANASHGQLVLNTPSGEHMFSELVECHEGKVVFVVTKEMIDELIEIGFYSFQIRLYDSAEMKSRVTIPPVMNGFDIRNPIAAEDEAGVVDQGIVGYARIFKDQSNEELPTFDGQGNYNKTEWVRHDVITENKMNKIEDALYSINANVKESDVVMLNTLDKVKKDTDKYVKEHMTAHKNEVSEELEEFSGELDEFSGELESVNSQLAHKASEADLIVERERINNIIKLENGSTTGDMELIDGRIGIDGDVYSTIGDGIRSQLNRICTSKMLSYSLRSSGARTFSISETGMVLGRKYQIRIESYTGVCNVDKIDINFIDVNGSTLKKYTNINVGGSIYCELPTDAVNMKCLFYIDGTESFNARFKMSVTSLITDALYKEQFNEIDDSINKLQDTILTSYIPLRYSLIESGIRTYNLNEIGIKTNDSYFIKIENYTGVCKVNKIDVRFIDTNGNSLKQYDDLNIGDCIYCEVPTGAISLRFLFYIDGTEQDISTFTMTVFKHTLEDVVNEKLKRLMKTKKIINCLGDSFTSANTSWHTFIGDRLGYEMINLGVAGTRISNTYTSGSGTTYTGFIDRVKNGVLNVDADLTVIFGGINDTVRLNNKQLEIGTVDDEVGANTFCGKLKELIELIWTKMPGKPILGVIPPLYSEGTSNHEWWYEILLLIQEVERKVYKHYGIPYVDLKYNSQEMHINDYNLSTYRINGLSDMHPSKKGYEAISIPIQKGIEKMFID